MKKKASPNHPFPKADGPSASQGTHLAAEADALPQASFPVIGIGASAGGLEALERFFDNMPPDSTLAFVVVTHLAPTHKSTLPALLQKKTSMPVREICQGMALDAGAVYVIPPGKELAIDHATFTLNDRQQKAEASLQPINAFFHSLAENCGTNAVGIILSGSGSDGAQGLKAIKAGGGMVMVQDESTARHRGMPHSALYATPPDFLLPPEQMPHYLGRYLQRLRTPWSSLLPIDQEEVIKALDQIFTILREHSGHDFSQYKRNALTRRIVRRMNIRQLNRLEDYVQYLEENPGEVGMLFQELLIGVTGFFRDPQVFATLAKKVLPELLKKHGNTAFRVWVSGCSSGEEAYSFAILLDELSRKHDLHCQVQIFATDIDERAIQAARLGEFPASIAETVGDRRLEEYFIKNGNHFRVKKHIREMVVFASQNLIQDPPFTRLDMICCRNLLIYLDQKLQRKVLAMFHYSLKPDGILVLGMSESPGRASHLFTAVDKKWKIYKRKDVPGTAPARPLPTFLPNSAPLSLSSPGPSPLLPRWAAGRSAGQLAEAILHHSSIPPCALVDEASNIVYIHGRLGRYLEPAPGKLNVNIVEMARPGLEKDLADAIHCCRRNRQTVRRTGVTIQGNGTPIRVDLVVMPIKNDDNLCDLAMVMFVETGDMAGTDVAGKIPAEAADKDAAKLELELRYTQRNLQKTIEELEVANEELRSSNEELQSNLEELQSTNEELETAADGLARVNDDLKNFIESSRGGTIFLDINLGITRFTPTVTDLIPLTDSDYGRPLSHFASQLVDVDLNELATKVLEDLNDREAEVGCRDGRFFRLRARPYRSEENVIKGVVLTFVDISREKRLQGELTATTRTVEGLLKTLPTPALVVDRSLTVRHANEAFFHTFRVTRATVENRPLAEIGDGDWNLTDLRPLLAKRLPRQKKKQARVTVKQSLAGGGRRTMLVNALAIAGEGGATEMFVLTFPESAEEKEGNDPKAAE